MNATLKLGEHFIFDLSNCNHEILMDSEQAYSLFAQAVHESGLTVVDEGFYKFSPHGFTCFLLLAESHASLHAWQRLTSVHSVRESAPVVHSLSGGVSERDFETRRALYLRPLQLRPPDPARQRASILVIRARRARERFDRDR